MNKLNVHPRLYIGPRELQRLRGTLTLPVLLRAATELESEAREYASSPDFDWPQNTHNAHLIRARLQQRRVISLLVQWLRSGERVYRAGAVAHLRAMAGWEYWSWLAWRDGLTAPDTIWDLSYGENAATLAVAWDLLYDTLVDEEREILLGMARKWVAPSFMKHTEPGQAAWWVGASNSNWLAVCAGGGGLVAMAMFEELPEAAVMLERANTGMNQFMRSLQQTGGGWAEGVAYWNYGMRYAFMYLLSYEAAFGAKHPAFDLPETQQTLRFPLLFSPCGKTCGFGDISDTPWLPVALHYAAASRLGAADIVQAMDALPANGFENSWATRPELLALHPGETSVTEDSSGKSVVQLYPGLGWGCFADRMPDPSFYVSVRGGTTGGPHNCADLLSWHCLVNGERLVSNVTNHEYLDTTFSDRRFEMPEIRQDTKNTLLIGGVGIAHPGTAETSRVMVGGYPGIRIDATEAFHIGSHGASMVKFAGRLFVFIKGRALLILDRVELKHTNRIETRLHTYALVKLREESVRLTAAAAVATVAFASTVPCCMATSLTAPTNPSETPAQVLRWATSGLHDEVTLATCIVPGRSVAKVALVSDEQGITAKLRLGRSQIILTCGRDLLP